MSTAQDPEQQGPKPPFPEQEQAPAGLESEMRPRSDYGEQSRRVPACGWGRLTGRAALITGGDSGIGRAVALVIAREGADVLLSYVSEESDAREAVQVIEAAGRRAIAVPGDIQSEQHCRALGGRGGSSSSGTSGP